jgi:excinuclease ABC subunit A
MAYFTIQLIQLIQINHFAIESLETALNLSAGLVRIASMDEASKQEELVFSAKFSCVECGYSLTELEPRLFSFNNPVGACQSCDGLGVQDVFDENKVVSNPEASLANGAIYGWGRSNAYFYQILTLVGQYYGFSVDTPYQATLTSANRIIK